MKKISIPNNFNINNYIENAQHEKIKKIFINKWSQRVYNSFIYYSYLSDKIWIINKFCNSIESFNDKTSNLITQETLKNLFINTIDRQC